MLGTLQVLVKELTRCELARLTAMFSDVRLLSRKWMWAPGPEVFQEQPVHRWLRHWTDDHQQNCVRWRHVYSSANVIHGERRGVINEQAVYALFTSAGLTWIIAGDCMFVFAHSSSCFPADSFDLRLADTILHYIAVLTLYIRHNKVVQWKYCFYTLQEEVTVGTWARWLATHLETRRKEMKVSLWRRQVFQPVW